MAEQRHARQDHTLRVRPVLLFHRCRDGASRERMNAAQIITTWACEASPISLFPRSDKQCYLTECSYKDLKSLWEGYLR